MRVRAFTAADAAVIGGLLVLCWVLWDGAGRNAEVRQVEIVSVAGTARYPLAERRLQVPGPLGDSTVRIRSDSVAFESSPCPYKLCVRTGSLRRSGQFAACLPNRVAVRLLPGAPDGGEVDAVGR